LAHIGLKVVIMFVIFVKIDLPSKIEFSPTYYVTKHFW